MADTTVKEHKFSTSYEDYYNNAAANAEKQKQAAISTADNALNAANVDAQAQYKQAAATYGAKAETLASMGLTGSGYSDYLEGKAYEQMNAAKIAAQKEHNTAVRAANDGYDSKMDTLNQGYLSWTESEKQKQQTGFSSLLTAANTGNYTDDQLKGMAAELGYKAYAEGDESWNTILGANSTVRNKAQGAILQQLIDKANEGVYNNDQLADYARAIGYTGSMLTEAVEADADKGVAAQAADATWNRILGYNETARKSLTATNSAGYKSNLYNEETDEIGYSIDEYDSALAQGLISQSDRDALVSANNNAALKSIIKSLGGTGADDKRSPEDVKADARLKLNKLLSEGKIDEPTKTALENVIDGSSDAVVTSSVSFKSNAVGKDIFDSSTKYADGDKFKVSYTDTNGETVSFNVASAGRVDAAHFGGAKVPTSGREVFGYKGDLYMALTNDDGKLSGYVKLKARGNASGYNKLWKAVYGNIGGYGTAGLFSATTTVDTTTDNTDESNTAQTAKK